VPNYNRAGTPQLEVARQPRADHEPSDAEWLKGISVRAKLADPTRFDRDALCWRAARRLRDTFPPELLPTAEEAERGRTLFLAVAEGRFSCLMAFVWDVPPPELWTACSRCQGTGRSGVPVATCRVCDGAGYEVPLP
jgi:hypothetical protein